ncbi:MAG: sugar phosphate nucleotidyltransferase [Luteolibacter sp.]
MSAIEQAFILGAGMGTRLRPLTRYLPKPMVPLYHRPLAAWAFDECMQAGIRRFAINTHHLPNAWHDFQKLASCSANTEIDFFHEATLLDTGGGLKNIEAWTRGKPLLVHNGDIYSNIPLDRLIQIHQSSGCPVTLALRSTGAERRVGINREQNRVTDLRHLLGVDPGTHVFTGIYCVEPDFIAGLTAAGAYSIIPAFLELARINQLAAAVMDDGDWIDLGDRQSYLAAHAELNLAQPIHPDASIGDGCRIENSVVGPHCQIGQNAQIRNSVLWPGSVVLPNTILDKCIVCSGRAISGCHVDEDC